MTTISNITVLIQTYNQERNIEECIKSAQLLTRDIVVIDLQSTDKTSSILRRNKVKTFKFQNFDYVEPVRNYGISKTTGKWVFVLDSDERITESLSKEIKKAIHNNKYTHYKIPRINYFARYKILKHGGWNPDYIIRLFNKKYFKDWPKEIHSTPIIKGNCGYLHNHIVHYRREKIEEAVCSTIIFEDVESELLYKAKKKVNTLIFFKKFFGELYRRLIKKLGFLDGEVGIIESIYQAFSKTITYLFLYEKNTKPARSSSSRAIQSLS